MLELSDLTKRYGDVAALDGVSFRVGDGDLVGFLGPNGAGKTTTMRAVLGLVRLDRGTLTWDGAPVGAAERERFGYMPEERGLYPRMRVLDQVVYFATLTGIARRDADRRARTWLERLGLGDRFDDDVQSLSHGNQQRVQLAVALVHEPDLLVLDEPFSGLDPIGIDRMKELLAEQAARGTAVLFSSHQLDLVADVCRSVVIVDHGRVVLSGEVEHLRDEADVRVLEVAFDREVDRRWIEPLVGRAVEGAPGAAQRTLVPATVTPADALRAAEGTGARVVRFSFEPPDLSEVFRSVVGHGVDQDDEGEGLRAPTAGEHALSGATAPAGGDGRG